MTPCFHCGLPVPGGRAWESRVLDEVRSFCCGGCLAVAEEICSSGLADYYGLRTAPAGTAVRAASPDEADETIYDRGDLQKACVRSAGAHRRVSLYLEGVRCPACLWINERRLRAVPGVLDATVAYASRTAGVTWDPNRVKLSAILRSVREIGYQARPVDSSHRASLEREGSLRDTPRLVFAGVVGMMVMNLALAAYFLGASGNGPLALWEAFGRWAALAASAALLAYPGQDFFAGAWRDLRNRRAGMDLPLVLGLSAAWIGSAWSTVRGAGPVYFDAVAMLIFFVLLARAAESRARLAAAAELDACASVQPAIARRIEPGGAESRVPAVDLRPGDTVRVLPGEFVPADGVLFEGTGAFDESVLTGEPWPRTRGAGEPVIAGSRNLEEAVVLRVTRAGESSTIGEAQKLLERGLASRPAAAELADRISGWIVGVVLGVSAATAAWWAFHDPSRAIPATVAVLIVTCPCALALATPIGLTLAAARLARAGVMPARMSAIEPLARADTAVFDKTGTLTLLSPRLAALETFGGLDGGSARSIADALEQGSLHPIAGALGTPAAGVPSATEIDHVPGRGVSGVVEGARWWLGSPDFAAGPAGASVPPAIEAAIADARRDGNPAALLLDRRGRGALFVFSEDVRPGGSDVVAGLRAEGIRRFVLLSGDPSGAAARLGASLGFDAALPAMTPDAKLEWVRRHRRAGGAAPLLYVGDGVNDAPALGAAGVSMSFLEAPQISRLACDFLIARRDLGAVVDARRIARRTRRLLVQNVGWAIAYNVVSIPLAAAGLVPPWAAALGMSASSLLVVGNAMRLGSGGVRDARASGHLADAPR